MEDALPYPVGTLPPGDKMNEIVAVSYTHLPGERPDFVSDGKNYTIYTEACQKLYIESTTNLGYKQLEGCTPISGTPTFAAKYYNMARDSIKMCIRDRGGELRQQG